MNKGLELIEAHHLFGVPYEQIDVVVHPQSIVHALVHLNDGASLAHLGYPDMRVPISYALHHPERADVPVRTLDLVELGALTFEAPDAETFACLRLAREAAAAGGTAPCVLNAANEVAVHAFLRGELSFTGIAAGDRVDAGRAAGAPGAALLRPLHGRLARRATWRAGWPRELGPGLRGLRAARDPARARPLLRRPRPWACGWRSSRCSSRRRCSSKKLGETEYAIGAIPAGGYVKISGMNPAEDLPDEVRDARLPRAAGVEADRGDRRGAGDEPGAGVRAAVRVLLPGRAASCRPPTWASSRRASPPQGVLQSGDKMVAVDGARRRRPRLLRPHQLPPLRRAAGAWTAARPCQPATVTVVRDGERRSSSSRRSTTRRPQRMRLGFAYAEGPREDLAGVRAGRDDRPVLVHHEGHAGAARPPDRPRAAQGDLRAWSAPTRPRGRRSSTSSPT